MEEKYGIAAFRSRQQVMRMQETLKNAGVNSRVVSTPREISAGCGLSLQFDLGDAARVKSASRQINPANMIGLYRVENSGGRRTRLSALNMRG